MIAAALSQIHVFQPAPAAAAAAVAAARTRNAQSFDSNSSLDAKRILPSESSGLVVLEQFYLASPEEAREEQ